MRSSLEVTTILGRGSPFCFGLSATQAAEAVGVGLTTFLQLVEEGKMPRPRCIRSRKLWDVDEVRECFKALPHDKQIEEANTWSDLEG